MDLDQIWVVTRRRALVGADEMKALETSLGGALPPSFHAFLARFGRGSFVDVLRVLGSKEILEQPKLASFAPWKNYADYVPANARLVPIAISLDGDMVVAQLDDPSMMFILPRHRDAIDLAETFAEALAWFSDSGVYWPRSKRPWFESNVGRAEVALELAGASNDPHEAMGHLLEALPPDHDAVDLNPCDELFYRDADAVVQWVGSARLRVRADEAAMPAFVERVVAALARGGWQATRTI